MRTVPANRYKNEILAIKIVYGQEKVLGSFIARGLARQAGVVIEEGDRVVFSKPPILALSDLVKEYSKTFGEASNEVSREVLFSEGLSQSQLQKIIR
ncbi:hypothetical protein L6255_03345 [Candidatus Parcubacteria bacterium]|nr:hypothetical protein [Patescibacteria group bacterium]MBU4380930.1 hypothetical protein [Patescibacteria group bacterium]MCG2689448.1 hypothetical protein [Candidatus Parcubacteria bacterium]